MPKFFIQKSNLFQNSLEITGQDAYHIAKVLRMREGEKLVVVDEEKTEYVTVIKSIGKNSVCTEILCFAKNDQEPEVDITLFQGIPKQAKMESIIQKSVEIGARAIIPVMTERTVIKMDGTDSNKLSRWRKIAKEAAKQCQRGIIPLVENPVTYTHIVSMISKYDLIILPYEKELNTKISQCIKAKESIRNACVIIGPEGGFTEQEVKIAMQQGAIPVNLGARMLRTETASIVALTLLMHELGQM